MQELFSLGDLYPSDFLKEGEEPRSKKHKLKLLLDDNGVVRLESQPSADEMWGQKYWYRSATNKTMQKHLKDVVDSISSICHLSNESIWLDIASNDGTLLSFVDKKISRVGIDPCNDSFKEEAKKHASVIIQDYFSEKAYFSEVNFQADVITCISMFYDLQNPDSFLQDVNKVLERDGIFCVQMAYTPLMILQNGFDNICHEHFSYFSFFNFKSLVERNGFKVMDVSLNDCNGGSFRVYMMKKEGNEKLFGSQPYRDVCNFRINSLFKYEKTLNLDSKITWMRFFDSINELKEKTVSFIKEEKAKGKVIYGYGASTKFNTLLQWFELDNTMITAIAERSEYKYGLRTVGTNIPIISEEQMRKDHPDYLLVGPWFFIHDFCQREYEYLSKAGKFIVPCPKFEVIGH